MALDFHALSDIYDDINNGIFNNELPTVYIWPFYSDYADGFCVPVDWLEEGKGYNIGIDATLDNAMATRTLIHEIAHCWQFEKGWPLNHGKRFKLLISTILEYLDIREPIKIYL